MSLRELLIGLLVIAVAASGVAWFFANHEPYYDEVWVGFRGEAKRNPWLAAQRFLGRVGIPAEALRRPPEAAELVPGATLIVPQGHHAIGKRLRERITQWVEGGGNLVIEAEHALVDDPLLDTFGVRRSAAAKNRNDVDKDGDGFAAITLPGATEPAKLVFHGSTVLHAEDGWFSAACKYGTCLLIVRRAKGMVTVVSDIDFLSNHAIGDHDHARFLLDLVRLPAAVGVASGASAAPVLFLNQPRKLSLVDWLRQHAWAPLSAVTLVLLLWLWQTVVRFGPIAPDPLRSRRSLLDHLRASGRFLWANGYSRRLLEASREACIRRIAQSFPSFLSATPRARAEQLGSVLGLSGEQTEYIVTEQQDVKMLQFLEIVRLYQSVYTRLADYPKSSNERAK